MAAILSATTLVGDKVTNADGEDLGKVEELMIDVESGSVDFAVPWASLAVDQKNKQLILNVTRDMLETAEGFDKDHWPDMADRAFMNSTYSHYGIKPW